MGDVTRHYNETVDRWRKASSTAARAELLAELLTVDEKVADLYPEIVRLPAAAAVRLLERAGWEPGYTHAERIGQGPRDGEPDTVHDRVNPRG